jgi:DNA-binding NarL/FixJ family response regulator
MRTLVADDHPLFRDGIVSLLEAADFEVVGQANNGLEAVSAARALQPDLVLLDITMPEMDGLEALQRIKQENPAIQVVMLTVSDDDEHLMEAIQNGANGYLLKNLNATQFLEMLAGLEHGEAAMTRKTTARLMAGFANYAEQVRQPDNKLTPRELELLRLVAEGLSNKAIGQQLDVSENTVKYHMRNILQKLNAQNRTEAATFALQAGWLDTDTADP